MTERRFVNGLQHVHYWLGQCPHFVIKDISCCGINRDIARTWCNMSPPPCMLDTHLHGPGTAQEGRNECVGRVLLPRCLVVLITLAFAFMQHACQAIWLIKTTLHANLWQKKNLEHYRTVIANASLECSLLFHWYHTHPSLDQLVWLCHTVAW